MKRITFTLVSLLMMSISTMAQTGTFKTAALNVDGMPKEITLKFGIFDVKTFTLNPDAKEAAGATAIGKKILQQGYDVIGLSEDFNYDNEIMAEISSQYREGTWGGEISQANATLTNYVTKKPLFTTDGLNLLYKKSITVSSETRTKWNEHYGYTDDGADGLITKGYRYYTVTVASGISIDLYILHMDANTSPADNAARETQLVQLANAIKASNNKRPIIVMGDTNCRYNRDKLETDFIGALNADARFTCKDVWIEHEHDGLYPVLGSNSLMVSNMGYQKGEVVDKVFYINNEECSYRIKSNYFLQDISFVNDAGEPLADHWPVVVEWTYYPASAKDQYEDNTVLDNPYGETTEYYLRNVQTKEFLKSGGWWGTHMMQGVYGDPIHVIVHKAGGFALQTPHGYVAADGYMDQFPPTGWELVKNGKYYSVVYDGNAISGNDIECNYGPNRHYAKMEAYNSGSTYQQWELLTRDDLIREMQRTPKGEFYNATFLLQDPNFDRNTYHDVWSCDVAYDASKMTSNLGGFINNQERDDASPGKVDHERGNYVGEVYVSDYSGSTTYATTWEVSQSLTNVPNGTYKVQMQGYLRVKTEPMSSSDGTGVYLSANSNSVKLPDMFSIQQTAISGGTTYSGYTYPNSMDEASYFFNAGYYQNEVSTDVTNGSLKVAVAKTTTSKGSSVWTCFDNFQLIYVGTAEFTVGDITKDGKWDVTDVTALVNIILGKHNYDAWDYNAADVNGDGEYTVADVTALVNIILGK